VRCGRCGNENAEGNRFCGMCGAPLAAKVQTQSAPSAASANTAVPAVTPASGATAPPRPLPQVPAGTKPAPPAQPGTAAFDETKDARRSAPPLGRTPRTPTGITGPSFLGLSSPPSSSREPDPRDDGSNDEALDHLKPSSSNLEYLLDDEEEPKSGKVKWILALAAIALVAAFGYLHWREGGFDWLTASNKKPATASDSAQAGTDSSSTTAPPPTPGVSGQPVANGASSAPVASAPPNPADSATPQFAPGAGSSQPAAEKSSSHPPSAGTSSPAVNAAAGNPGDSSSAQPASQADNSDAADQPRSAPAAPKLALRKPSATRPVPAKTTDAVTEAERYIYGRGVPQDCDRGLRILKPAAEHSDARAMISLGSLYSTGTCTPRDLPTSYRWFALALHKEPDNPSLQNDLQKLWSQMTQPERQLAIKLSQ